MNSDLSGFAKALEVMARLRAPDGCPWDREQDHQTLKPYIIEEAYEVIEAIDSGSNDDLREELGDLLLQVLFHSQLAQEKGLFNASEVAEKLADKMIDRHPHVFGEDQTDTTNQVLRNWEISKRKVRADRGKNNGAPSILDGVPLGMPALQRSHRLQNKAARVGFDWPDADGAGKKLEEEWGELKEAVAQGDQDAIESEMGDFLFSAVNYSRKLGVNAEDSTRSAISRFISRFHHIESTLRDRGISPEEVPLNELDKLWNEAKSAETQDLE
ncbi:MAG: nucleoside triphosphate pyrophosphohydrolase [Nitrospinaceae bacterium]|jgi:tetrapyrrole methylase family protein / MazG family protein|nr:nucleoside triphosphate pyrophosphohydrolase [Nitrospinaceae bacterium]MBT3434556.1 nucleoside triphosphate pyrophosphohydrolase [Nitrospinaceae bacterium]MBT3820855.1 nucleoside triphosphate pyrophosphohydrolase [Nitrospinaceae bacterium]MBT4431983.1 nucleoside triphosphate pyrophosphohydrolase [Nitrospinaceae bacterium]MBT5367540.1 nucleoside triphosphate pyrophosphohydrolase [Nitrospinaceae bacterium]